jgi:hypothetical protein
MASFISVPENLPQSNNASYEPLPKGKYEVTVFDIVHETVKSGENSGKPRWKVQLKVSSGEFENRRLFTLIPLYVGGDFWKTQSFFESLGYPVKGNFQIPETNDLLGKSLVVRVTIREANNGYEADNNVSGFEVQKSAEAGNLLAATLGATPVATESIWA